MRSSVVAFAVLIGGCASAPGTPAPRDAERVLIEDDAGRVTRTTADSPNDLTMERPLDDAYAAVVTAYIKLGIDVGTRDAERHIVGNVHVVAIHSLHGTALSRYLRCGVDIASGPLADKDRLTISVVSTLTALGNGTTRVSTMVEGTAQPTSGDSNDPTHCSSTGMLEQTLVKAANAS